ncbi:MAG TPA: hypothetical protein PLW14_12840 [Chlorobiota bacterium]|nr:hypothetical protein [Chlorobiota bacterium]
MSVRALLTWNSSEDGGRKCLPTGPTYSTVARFDLQENWREEAWSLWIDFEESPKLETPQKVKVRFLLDGPQILLSVGSRFALYEGSRVVARGEVVEVCADEQSYGS